MIPSSNTLTNAQLIKSGLLKKPIVVISKTKPTIPHKGRDWLFIASPDLNGERYLASDILMACCTHFGVSAGEMISPNRKEKSARFAFYYLTRYLTKLSLPQIGKIIHRDHSTVFHGIKVAARSPDIMRAVNQIKAGLVRIEKPPELNPAA